MQLTHGQKICVAENMRRFGGNFATHLANALIAADPENTRKICMAFPEIIEKYIQGCEN